MPSLANPAPQVSVTSLIVFSLISYFCYLIAHAVYQAFFSRLAAFPGPRVNALSQLPLLYQVWYGNEAQYVEKLHATYGPVVRTGPRELSFTQGAAANQAIYGFTKSGVHGMKDLKFYGKTVNHVPNLVVADNTTHSRQRKIISHSFSASALRGQFPMLRKWTGLLEEKLGDRADRSTPTDMVTLYSCTTFDIMGDLTFSEDLGMLRAEELSAWVKATFGVIRITTRARVFRAYALFNYLIDDVLLRLPSLHAQAVEHWKYTADRVDRRLERQTQYPDLMTKILEKEGQEGQCLLPGEHHSNAQLFMIAGTETTATTLSGITYRLLRHPKYLSLLTHEIRSTFSNSTDFTVDALSKLPWLNAALQEGLRIYPPVAVGLPRRTPPQGLTICDWEVPGDVTVACPGYATSRSEAHFRDAGEFRPERWLGDAAYAGDHLDAIEPFSTGPRNCLGKNLAWLEMRLVLATVLLNFDLQFVPGGEGEKGTWADQRTFTIWEKRALMVNLRRVSRV